MVNCNRVIAHFDILQKSESDPIDIVFRCFRWAYPIDMLKKYRLLMSRYFCVQSSSMMSASRPITVSTLRMILPGFKLSPPLTIREVLDGLDDEVNHCADGLKDRTECNHAHRLISINMRITIRRSSRKRVPGRTAFPRFLPRSSRNREVLAPHQRLRRMPSPR